MATEIELIVSAVTGALTGGVTRPLLAPADALAEHWKEKVRSRLDVVGQSASRKRGDTTLLVNERIAFRVLSEAAFTDDAVVLEYLAGVIAGSPATSDEGAPALAQIGRLSAFQLRLHYVIYREICRQHCRAGSASNNPTSCSFFAQSGLERVFGEPFEILRARLENAGVWLRREGLLAPEGQWDGWGRDDSFRLMSIGESVLDRGERTRKAYTPREPGLLVIGTEHGLDLFLWGCGKPRGERTFPLDFDELSVEFAPPIPPCGGLTLAELPETSFGDFKDRIRRDGATTS